MRGHITQTWMQAAHPNVFWPEWLQEDLPNLAVWSIGYSAPATLFGGSTMFLQDRAPGILALLAAKPELFSGKILFVTHSLGGLVVKQLLRSAELQTPHNPRIASFLNRVHGVAFLSTPHRGADLGSLGGLLRILSPAAQNLPRNDPFLRDLNRWYVGFSEGRVIKNLLLYETKRTGFVGTVVKPDSADAGLSVSSELIPVDEDHFSICKPKDRSSEVYVHLRLFLASVDDSSKGQQDKQARQQSLQEELTAPSSELLGYEVCLPDGRHFDRPEVQQLIEVVRDREQSVTVILGDPGSGKSALLSDFSRLVGDTGIAVLAIKADLLPGELENEEDLRRYLGLTLLPSVTFESIAKTAKAILVIDQLDALASYLDLKTGRLSVLLNLVRRLAIRNNIHIVMSARTFEYEHDVRLRSISAESISLELPPWEDVLGVLDAHGYKASGWPQDTKDLLRSPQALATFLRLGHSEQPLENYQAMLEKLWEEKLLSRSDGPQLTRLLGDIAQVMAEDECLWIAKVRFEDRTALLNTLASQGFLTSSRVGANIGFTHQSLFDHALARNFAREPGQLSRYVLERQASLFVRPKLWASLNYIREAEPSAYERELQAIWGTKYLRRHLTTLLVDFVGQQSKPTDLEELLISSAMERPDLRPHAFRAIVGSSGWFHRLKNSYLLRAMTEPPQSAHLVAGVLIAAWEFAPSEVMTMLQKNWSSKPDYDYSSWHVLTNSVSWSEEATALASKIINRTELAASTVNHLISQIAADHHDAAIELVSNKLHQELVKAKELSAARKELTPPSNEEEHVRWYISKSPTKPLTDLAEASDEWYSLESLAEAVPTKVFAPLWAWFWICSVRYATLISRTKVVTLTP